MVTPMAGRALAPHMRPGTEPHPFVLFVGRNVVNAFSGLNLINHTRQLFAGHGGHEIDAIGYEIIHNFAIYRHVFALLKRDMICLIISCGEVKILARKVLGETNIGCSGVPFHALKAGNARGSLSHAFSAFAGGPLPCDDLHVLMHRNQLHDLLGQSFVICDQPYRRVVAVLRLPHEIRGDNVGIRGFICKDQAIGGPGKHINANPTKENALGFRHKLVARPNENVRFGKIDAPPQVLELYRPRRCVLRR